MEEIKEKYLKLMRETFKSLVNYLEENNYNWFVAYGTLLGTVRHKGMIPWDDDIDIIMPRADFERLVSERDKIAKESHYKVIAPGDDNYYLTIGKYYDSNTTLWEHKHNRSLFGVYVDIFILDYYCGEEDALHNVIHKHQNIWGRYVNTITNYSWDYLKFLIKGRHLRNLLKFPKSYFRHLSTNREEAWERYSKFMKQFWNENQGKPRYCAWLQQDIVYKSEWFDDYLKMPFEDIEVRVPIGYHQYLTNRYGDYMTPPPVNKQVPNATHTQYYLNLSESLNIEEVKLRIKEGEHVKF